MSKIYIVIRGPHDDRHILAVFSRREMTSRSAATHNKYLSEFEYTADIEEYPVDEITDFAPVTTIYMDRNGNVTEFSQEFPGEEGFGGWSCGTGIYRDLCPVEDCSLIWSVKTDSRDEAIKATNKKRLRLIEANQWGKAPAEKESDR